MPVLTKAVRRCWLIRFFSPKRGRRPPTLTLWEAPNSEGLERGLRGFGPIPLVKARADAPTSGHVVMRSDWSENATP